MNVALPRLLCCWLLSSSLAGAGALRSRTGAGEEPQARLGGARLVRVQKAGGSVFGDVIMKKFCSQSADDCQGSAYSDWSQVTRNGAYHGPVVTLLRDPVERMMSEFFWLRSAEGRASASDNDWDFRNQTWLNLVQTDKDLENAFDVYLHGYEKNPSRNRQTLYLLGFRDGVRGDKRNSTVNPGAAYEWDVSSGKYVRWAMENLEKMTAYGITDCWMPSMRAIAGRLGWDTKAVEEFAAGSTPEYGRHEIDAKVLKDRVESGLSWRRSLSRDKVEEIERLNKVDLTVFRKALKRFTERFGEACSLPYEPFGPVLREFKKPAKA